ncbi:MAG: zinc ribbon domain-containing protein [Solirubrobacteraceae bacterium]
MTGSSPNGDTAETAVLRPAPAPAEAVVAPPLTSKTKIGDDRNVDLKRRRDQLNARVAELQWDLGGLVYEMAIRNRIRIEVLVQRAALLQEADAELGEVERILRLEETGMAGACANCGAPHSMGASFCWQCGQTLLAQVSPDAIG